MKKIGFIVAIFFCIAFSSIKTSAQKSEWGDWTSVECFSYIQFRLKLSDEAPTSAGNEIFIQFRSSLQNKVEFSYVAIDGNVRADDYIKQHGIEKRINLEGGTEDSGSISGTFPSNIVGVSVGYVKAFTGDPIEDSKRPYEICDMYPRHDQVCLMCELIERPDCQNGVVDKSSKILRGNAVAVAPRPVKKAEDTFKPDQYSPSLPVEKAPDICSPLITTFNELWKPNRPESKSMSEGIARLQMAISTGESLLTNCTQRMTKSQRGWVEDITEASKTTLKLIQSLPQN